MLHISHSHLCRVFRKKEGVSVVSYINALKMTKAEELLKKNVSDGQGNLLYVRL